MHTPSLLLAGAHFNDLTSLVLSQQFLQHSSNIALCVCLGKTRARTSIHYCYYHYYHHRPEREWVFCCWCWVVKGALIDLLEKLSPRKQQPHRVCAGCVLLTKINIIAAMHISTEPPPSRAALSLSRSAPRLSWVRVKSYLTAGPNCCCFWLGGEFCIANIWAAHWSERGLAQFYCCNVFLVTSEYKSTRGGFVQQLDNCWICAKLLKVTSYSLMI